MKITLDNNLRKFIEIEIELEDQTHTLCYFERNTKQIKEIKKITKKKDTKMYELDEISEKHFYENLRGEQKIIDTLVDFYEENGNIFDFIKSCDESLGKLKAKA